MSLKFEDIFDFGLLIKKLGRIGDDIYVGTKTLYLDIKPEHRREVGENQVLLVFVDGFLDEILSDKGKKPQKLFDYLGMSDEDLIDKLMEFIYNNV